MNSRQAVSFCKHFSLGAAILFSVAISHAQQSAPLAEQKQSSVEVLKAFEPAADQEYELGRGDEISVDVAARPELSGKHVIGPDGRITLPVAGDVELEGKTRSQAGAAIRTALNAYYQNITVSVSVDRYTSNSILLLGAVEHPGLLSFDGTPTLLEVIARGGVGTHQAQTGSDGSNPSSTLSTPVTLPELCMIYRGTQTMVALRLRDLLRNGNPSANLRLKRNDIVFIPGDTPYVSIFGSVFHPGLQRLESTSTLTQLLAESGGPTDKGGRYAKIFVVHPASGNAAGDVQVFSFRDILEAKPLHPLFQSGDIIYVAENGFNRAADVIQKMSPLISLITVGALLGQ